MTFPIDIVGDTDLDCLALVKPINDGDGEVGDSVNHTGVTDENHIEPTASAGATCRSAELHTTVVEILGNLIIFRDEWT